MQVRDDPSVQQVLTLFSASVRDIRRTGPPPAPAGDETDDETGGDDPAPQREDNADR
jgi:hypothetical protein